MPRRIAQVAVVSALPGVLLALALAGSLGGCREAGSVVLDAGQDASDDEALGEPDGAEDDGGIADDGVEATDEDHGAPDEGGGPDGDAGDPADDGAQSLAIQRLGPTFEIPTVPGGKRHADVAFDPLHEVYLVVHGNAPVGGAFLDSDGSPVGAPFEIPETDAWTQTPSVAWCPAAAGFLVVWHDTRANPDQAELRGRLVALDGGAARMLGPDFGLGGGASYQEVAAAIACATDVPECLVVWTLGTGALTAQRVGAAGALLGPALALSPADWNADPAIALPPGGNAYLVAHSFADATGAAVHALLVEKGTSAILGPPQVLGQAAGTWAAQAQWDPLLGRFLTAWWDGAARGLFLGPDGSPQGEPFPLAPGCGAYDGLALAYNPAAGLFAAALHAQDAEDWAALIGADGASGPCVPATASPAGTNGNYNPRIAAHATRPEWLLVSVRDYAVVVGQRLFGSW
ncbi:MAG TPA: hypothetical protein P5076_11935 [Myxococcota bacterium]|nr:hypothetical protein [Myxococcota bacterium]